MPSLITRTKQNILSAIEWIDGWVEELRGTSKLIKADFYIGGKTMYGYLHTHKNRYYRHVGAHFLLKLYEAGPEVLEGFAEKHRESGWHFPLTAKEQMALKEARDITCTQSQISGLRYSTNVFNQFTNRKQLLRMLGLGAVAGSAGILLGLSELLFFAKEYSKDLISSTLGVTWEDPQSVNSEFVTLANKITEGATNPDGSLNAEIVADRIAHLVKTLEEAGNSETVVKYMNADTSYVVGIISGIVILVIGRGMVQLVLEGVTGAVAKIDALVRDMDEYCDWKLGRSPFPPTAADLPGDLILPSSARILPPNDVPPDFRAADHGA